MSSPIRLSSESRDRRFGRGHPGYEHRRNRRRDRRPGDLTADLTERRRIMGRGGIIWTIVGILLIIALVIYIF
jgi:hypothetical protein